MKKTTILFFMLTAMFLSGCTQYNKTDNNKIKIQKSIETTSLLKINDSTKEIYNIEGLSTENLTVDTLKLVEKGHLYMFQKQNKTTVITVDGLNKQIKENLLVGDKFTIVDKDNKEHKYEVVFNDKLDLSNQNYSKISIDNLFNKDKLNPILDNYKNENYITLLNLNLVESRGVIAIEKTK